MRASNSMAWSKEEARYFRALLSWEPSEAELDVEVVDSKRNPHSPPPSEQRPLPSPVGEFRFLVLGAKGCGKTSILTRFSQGTFASASETHHQPPHPNPDHHHERGGIGVRHRVLIDSQPYTVDALELPSQHLTHTQSIQQAVHITEAAVLVYDVRSRASFALLQGLHDLIRDTVECGSGGGRRRREYGLVVVGAKADADAEFEFEFESESDGSREVPWAEGYQLARGFRLRCLFLETSAKTGEGVGDVFPLLGKEVLRLRWAMQQQRLARKGRRGEEEDGDEEDDDNDVLGMRWPKWRWRGKGRIWMGPWSKRTSREKEAGGRGEGEGEKE